MWGGRVLLVVLCLPYTAQHQECMMHLKAAAVSILRHQRVLGRLLLWWDRNQQGRAHAEAAAAVAASGRKIGWSRAGKTAAGCCWTGMMTCETCCVGRFGARHTEQPVQSPFRIALSAPNPPVVNTPARGTQATMPKKVLLGTHTFKYTCFRCGAQRQRPVFAADVRPRLVRSSNDPNAVYEVFSAFEIETVVFMVELAELCNVLLEPSLRFNLLVLL